MITSYRRSRSVWLCAEKVFFKMAQSTRLAVNFAGFDGRKRRRKRGLDRENGREKDRDGVTDKNKI